MKELDFLFKKKERKKDQKISLSQRHKREREIMSWPINVLLKKPVTLLKAKSDPG